MKWLQGTVFEGTYILNLILCSSYFPSNLPFITSLICSHVPCQQPSRTPRILFFRRRRSAARADVDVHAATRRPANKPRRYRNATRRQLPIAGHRLHVRLVLEDEVRAAAHAALRETPSAGLCGLQPGHLDHCVPRSRVQRAQVPGAVLQECEGSGGGVSGRLQLRRHGSSDEQGHPIAARPSGSRRGEGAGKGRASRTSGRG